MRSLISTITRLSQSAFAGLKALWRWLGLMVFRINVRRFGNYIDAGPRRWRLVHHPTDFSVIRTSSEMASQVEALSGFDDVRVRRFATGISRISARPDHVNPLMDKLRPDNVVHHIYQVEGREEIAITDRVFLTLKNNNDDTLKAICERYKLRPAGSMGSAYVLEVSDESGANPLKLANLLARRKDVESCVPETLLPVTPSNAVVATFPSFTSLATEHTLLDEQWVLNSRFVRETANLEPTAGINAYEAWELVGQDKLKKSPVVIAVIDEGFNFEHPAFGNPNIKPDKHGFDFVDGGDTNAFEKHGLSVASIAAANADQMMGVAPGCAVLPLRIDLSPDGEKALLQEVLLKALTIASDHADVVNCSFSHKPESIDRKTFVKPLTDEIGKLIDHGGREKNGLVIVFAAGNDDAPICLSREKNKNGIKFRRGEPGIPRNEEVHNLYAEFPGVVVVGAMSSLKKKSGYSNWGRKLTVTAPSDNTHLLASDIFRGVAGTPGFGDEADYVGRDVKAATGSDKYGLFDGTSAAAPLVTGVVALMRSVNSKLKAKQIIEILKSTADRKDFPDVKLDVPGDPNLQGLNVDFDSPGPNGRSLIFGSGKVDAREAVKEAIKRLNVPAVVVAPGAGHP